MDGGKRLGVKIAPQPFLGMSLPRKDAKHRLMWPLTVASVVATESGQEAFWTSDDPVGPSDVNIEYLHAVCGPPRTPEPIR
ncbi:MAG: hypothetical protein AMXMBFR84_16900 [Candidatus Hydrogenedentota bacterium]